MKGKKLFDVAAKYSSFQEQIDKTPKEIGKIFELGSDQ